MKQQANCSLRTWATANKLNLTSFPVFFYHPFMEQYCMNKGKCSQQVLYHQKTCKAVSRSDWVCIGHDVSCASAWGLPFSQVPSKTSFPLTFKLLCFYIPSGPIVALQVHMSVKTPPFSDLYRKIRTQKLEPLAKSCISKSV